MRICIIGNSGHGLTILPELDRRQDIQVTGFCEGYPGEPNRTFRQEVVEKRQHKVRWYHSYRAMLEEERPDLVVIDGIFGEHGAMTMEALRRGIHVFVDKPVATQLKELDELEAVARNSSARLFAMLTMRYEATFYTARRLVEAGSIGQLRMLTGQKSYKLGKRPDFYRDREQFGGITPWISIHIIDLILWIARKRCISVSSLQDNHYNHGYGELEMTSLCSLQLEDNILASINSDYYRPKAAPTHGDDRLRIVGTEGILEVMNDRLTLISQDEAREMELMTPPDLFADCLRRIEMKDFSQDMDGIESTRISLLSRQSADEGGRLLFREERMGKRSFSFVLEEGVRNYAG